MPAFWIVKHLDVIEDIQPGFLPAAVDFSFDSLTFEQLKKTFCDSVVMAVSPPAHAGLQLVGKQEILPVMTAELASLIGMDQDFLLGPSSPNRHL